jgi:hypothetical protein
MFHLSLTNKGDSSYAKLETIAAGTGLHSFTVKIARSWLRDNGWLELVLYRKFGSASLPELRCVVPGPRVQKTPPLGSGMVQKTPGLGSRRLKKTPWGMVQKTPSVGSGMVQITPAEVDLNLEVHENPEVERTPETQLTFRTMATPVIPIVKYEPGSADEAQASALWEKIHTAAKLRVNPHSFSTWFRGRGESFCGQTLRVSVPNSLFVKRLHATYGDLLREILIEIGRPDVALEFLVIQSETPAAAT